MPSFKTAGQWDNTIVLFASDNGGAIFTNGANNNFPLRGSKLPKGKYSSAPGVSSASGTPPLRSGRRRWGPRSSDLLSHAPVHLYNPREI